MNIPMFYGLVTVALVLSFVKDRGKTVRALRKALRIFLGLLPVLVPIMIFVGLSLSLLSPETISAFLGERSGFLGVVLGLGVGAVAFLPGFVAFPLGAELLNHGAGYPQVAALIAALMGVGVSSLPMELRLFGVRVTLLRNMLCFIVAVAFTALVWGLGL